MELADCANSVFAVTGNEIRKEREIGKEKTQNKKVKMTKLCQF